VASKDSPTKDVVVEEAATSLTQTYPSQKPAMWTGPDPQALVEELARPITARRHGIDDESRDV